MIAIPDTHDQDWSAVARAIDGVQAAHLGRDRSGVDCAGAVKLAFAEHPRPLSIVLPATYALRWFETQPAKMKDWIERQLRWRRVYTAIPGTVLLFAVLTTVGDHPGVYVGDGLILHAHRGKVRTSPLTEKVGRLAWLDRLVAVYQPRSDECR